MIEEEKRVGLPQGWQRAETLNGSVPFYINHDTETTQWNHPEMTQLMTDLSGVNDIKYAAYRTAVKLRAIGKKTQLYSIDLSSISAGFNDLGYSESFSEDEIDVPSLEGVLTEIFSYQSAKNNNINVAEGVELTLNWLLNVYDQARSGTLRILSAKIGLTCLSVASVQEKYKYIFHQLSSSKGFINKKRLRVFLNDAFQMLKYIKEYSSFGKAGVEPTVQSCFERAYIPERICLQEFLDWMIAEPQTVVWLPTFHRLALSETVKHEGKCNICKMFPIVGFRYRCLKCFNFDMCQSCFWSGRISKNHKLTHQTQEYCLPATQTEDIKDFAKVVKSKVRKKKKKTKKDPSKGRFLPIPNDNTVQASDEENSVDDIDYGDAGSTTSFESQYSSDRLLKTEKNTSTGGQPTSPKLPSRRPAMDDEHHLISYYSSCLNDERQPTTSTPIATLASLDRDHIREMDEIVDNLEDDNRYLQEMILEIQDAETQRSIVQTEEREHVKDYNERLEARQEVLEDHNRRLEDQLAKLRVLIQQEKYTPPRNNISIPRQEILPRSEDTTKQTYQSTARHPFQYHLENYSPFPTASGHYDGQTEPFPEAISKEIKSDALDYSLSRPKQNIVSSWDSTNEENFKDFGASDVFGATLDSTTSNDDLRAIEERMERLLASETEETIREKPMEEAEFEYGKLQDSVIDSQMTSQRDSSFSDEQQSCLLTAASMVGEAVEDFVTNLSGEKTRWKYLELDFTDDEDEV